MRLCLSRETSMWAKRRFKTLVLHLLKRLLLSKTPLTDVFLGELNVDHGVDLDLKVIALDSEEMVQPQTEKEICTEYSKKMIVKLFQSKLSNKVLYAEGGEEFADLLFSLLAFPLGSIVKCLGGRTSMGCLDNLYKSVEDLNYKDCMKSEECKQKKSRNHSKLQQNSMAAKQMSLTLLVDKERNRVIYAESGKDFVEILLSFLTLPIGTVLKLSGKQSKMGSLTMLCKSLEECGAPKYQSTQRHAAPSQKLCRRTIQVSTSNRATYRTKYYICTLDCCIGTHGLVSTVKDAPCLCGKKIGWRVHEEKRDVNADEISVVCSTVSFALLRELGISDMSVLEERYVSVGEDEVLHLVKRLSLSKTPLTDVFLRELNTEDDEVDLDLKLIALNSDDMV
ncbi:hypothetical protein CKAN_01264400 [Cinnamomum micranthum f. kanehirae]|uniref:DUF674 domain-containing protein n=1 Tax=Cinnamomum micranthum f. kanehirae TaxID=337451 RepID=A0A443NZD5_9MAGN|nr:hypothetical protein CKAN_01264400 [Cinnamomum micranthum f. kanehirae]